MTGTIVVATGNADKLIEIRQILSDPGLEIISMKDAGVDVEIIENGTTFEENAVIIDTKTTKELDDMFWRDKQKSFQLTDETWDEFRTGWQKFRGWFAHLLQPFL